MLLSEFLVDRTRFAFSTKCTVISPTDTLEQAKIADAELQFVVKENELAKFLDVSYKWLSKYSSPPSLPELKQFVKGGWLTFDDSDSACGGHGRISDDKR